MAYIIKNDENQYFATHTGEVTTNINFAKEWREKRKAENVLNNISASLKTKNFYVEHIVHKDNTRIIIDRNESIDNKDLVELVQRLSNIREGVTNRSLYLVEQISRCDIMINDIEHAAEFQELNAAEGYGIYKNLHAITNERRKYKNELERLTIFANNISNEKLKNLCLSLDGLESKKYSPRIMHELFKK